MNFCCRLRIPRRPAWDESTTPDQLDEQVGSRTGLGFSPFPGVHLCCNLQARGCGSAASAWRVFVHLRSTFSPPLLCGPRSSCKRLHAAPRHGLQERTSFYQWRRELASLEQDERLVLTPFEKASRSWLCCIAQSSITWLAVTGDRLMPTAWLACVPALCRRTWKCGGSCGACWSGRMWWCRCGACGSSRGARAKRARRPCSKAVHLCLQNSCLSMPPGGGRTRPADLPVGGSGGVCPGSAPHQALPAAAQQGRPAAGSAAQVGGRGCKA